MILTVATSLILSLTCVAIDSFVDETTRGFAWTILIGVAVILPFTLAVILVCILLESRRKAALKLPTDAMEVDPENLDRRIGPDRSGEEGANRLGQTRP